VGCVLVTGGAGFIGSHLVERLVKEGYKVIVVDNLLRGNIGNLSRIIKDVQFVKCDVRNHEIMDGIIKKPTLLFIWQLFQELCLVLKVLSNVLKITSKELRL